MIHALPTLYAVRKVGLMRILHGLFIEQFESLLPGKPWVDDVIIIDKKQLKSLLIYGSYVGFT